GSALPDARDVDWFVRALCEEEPLVDNPRSSARERDAEPMLLARIAEAGGDLFDGEWLSEHAGEIVKKVRRLEVANEGARPRSSALQQKKRAGKHEEKLPQAVFALDLREAAAAAHLRPGDCWDSCAYADELWASGEADDEPVECVDPTVGKKAYEKE